ncbi:MAG: FHA domain-containing protein [Eggerthellaceae bacterium]|nr:FHA domain-containing protein [Eggerthellaceae bacterium]
MVGNLEQCPVCDSAVQADEQVCSTCGFKFLESTQSFAPVALTEEEITSATEVQPTIAVLRIVRGPQIETTFQLAEGTYSIGRSPQCSIFLNDMTVSRQHAEIAQKDDGFFISDNKSFNGVWINNESITETKLRDGDIIQVGAFCLLYQESNDQ